MLESIWEVRLILAQLDLLFLFRFVMICFVLVLVLDRQPNYAMRCKAQVPVDGHKAFDN